MHPPSTIAVTGATGFVGQAVLEAAAAGGIAVRALTRRPQEPRGGVTWVRGALDNAPALAELVRGSDAVLHIAGVVNTPTRDGFVAGNVTGTLEVIEAARDAGVRRFVHVSSLSAREPDLSVYGWSKARGEQLVQASGLDWTIVRPPGVFGPGDTEMLDVFRMAARGVALLPPPGRISVIYVAELARLLIALTQDSDASIGAIYEPDDGRSGGWSHRGFARAVGRAAGRRHVSALHAPRWLLQLAARGDMALRRSRAKLTRDRAGYLAHPDWVVGQGAMPPAHLWRPELRTEEALAQTVAWYRAQGWLR